jgi:hypothetical protein
MIAPLLHHLSTRPLCRQVLRTLVLAAMALATTPGYAIILMSTGDPSANTTPPTGALSNSGWQYEASFGPFLGTAVGPHHFLTAKHVGIASNTFVYQGQNYTVTRWFDDPECDLRMFEVAEALPSYAPLYNRSDEQGLNVVVVGRGTQRGDPIYTGTNLNGWSWGPADGVQRWGENQITRAIYGRIVATFDRNGGANEADLSSGDSGGAVFINDAGVWKLAGINSEVDGPFSTTVGGAPFNAAIFDGRGLYGSDGQLMASSTLLPTGFSAVRISYQLPWILGIIDPALTEVSARGMVNSTNTLSADFVVAADGTPGKQVLVRGLGPTLADAGAALAGRLTDPLVELYNNSGVMIASNDDWAGAPARNRKKHKKRGGATAPNPVQATGLAPTDAKEAALVATLAPGHYTAVVRGANNSSGIGQIEVYDLDDGMHSPMENLATNGYVGASTQELHGGLIAQCSSGRLLVRAMGPSLTTSGATGVLADTVLELYAADGTLVASNDNWRAAPNAIDIWNSGLAPADDRESAILVPAASGPYNVIVRGANGSTGLGRMEVYLLP